MNIQTQCEHCKAVHEYYQNWIKEDEKRRNAQYDYVLNLYIVMSILMITGSFAFDNSGKTDEQSKYACAVIFWFTIGCIIGYGIIMIWNYLKLIMTPKPPTRTITDVENPITI